MNSQGSRWVRQRSKPLRPISPKRQQGTPGGEYTFTFAGKTYSLPGRMIIDPQSPDGLRWIATPESYAVIRKLLYESAGGHCQLKTTLNCWRWAPLNAGTFHHVHLRKMGMAWRDDRIEVAGERNGVWACLSCQSAVHNKLHWTRRSA